MTELDVIIRKLRRAAERTEAIRAIIQHGTDAVEPMCKVLAYDDKHLRRAAATVLAEVGDRRALGPLCEALSLNDDDLIRAAATALGRIGDIEALGPLCQALERCEDGPAVDAIVRALGEIAGKSRAPAIAEALIELDRGAKQDRFWRIVLQAEGVEFAAEARRRINRRKRLQRGAETIRLANARLTDLPVPASAGPDESDTLPIPSSPEDGR